MRVLPVSASLYEAGPTLAIMTVFAVPPRLSCNSFVKIEFRYGTNGLPVVNAEITFPNAARDKLMLQASRVRSAVVIFVFACRVDWALGRIYNARHGKATYNAFAACQIDKPEYTPADTGMLLAFTVVVIVASRFC